MAHSLLENVNDVSMSKIVYYSTIRDFVNIVSSSINSFMTIMSDKFTEYLGVEPGDSEMRSWENNAKALSTLFACSGLKDSDAYIGFEYLIPVGGRIDCVLFGKGSDGAKNMVHIELKQWSNENVHSYCDHQSYCADVIVDGCKCGSIYTSHPSAQASEYHNHLKNHIKVFEKENINLYGMAYCYNYDTTDDKVDLLDDFYQQILKDFPLFGKTQSKELTDYLVTLLGEGDGKEIMDAVLNSNVGVTKRLRDVAANMMSGKEGKRTFYLTEDQFDAFNAILGAVKNTSKNQKTAIIVKGGPGTGKSVLAIRLLSELYKEEYHCNDVYYATRSTSLRDGFRDVLKGIAYKNKSTDNAADLITSTFDFRPYKYNFEENGGDVLLVDEAHRIENTPNDQTDSHRPDNCKSNLSQVLAMLYTSRVCVFFIDDKQAIKKEEIGLSNKIKDEADSYYKSIIEKNDFFDNKEKPKAQKQLERERLKLKNAQLSNNDVEIAKISKRIRALERLINTRSVEPTIATVNVLEFELKSQFRCNGSNNYLDWIDSVIYSKGNGTKRKLDDQSYEFAVFDNPCDLYEKVISKDEYAVKADCFRKQWGESFSYKSLFEATKSMSFTTHARLVAGWCWNWKNGIDQLQDNGDLKKEVSIEEFNFAMPWETNSGTCPRGDFAYKYANDADSWCNQKEGVNQVGCIHSIQGWETDFVGVIIGPDLVYDEEKDCLKFNPDGGNHNVSISSKEDDYELCDTLIKNTYRVLLTRGKKGCFVFACDKGVRDYLRRCMNN